MLIHLFGSSSGAGIALQALGRQESLSPTFITYSRSSSQVSPAAKDFDLSNPEFFQPVGDQSVPSIWISFAPVWLFSKFFEYISIFKPDCLRSVKGLIVCSSSSVVTKRFAVNSFDRSLYERLLRSEQILLDSCQKLHIPCKILQPAMIYGKAGSVCDRNLSSLVRLMGIVPVLPMPSDSGLRQPIHVSQLAAVTMNIANTMFLGAAILPPSRCLIGGDSSLTYLDMIRSLQSSLPSGHPARFCRIIVLPRRLFFLIASFLIIISPKFFEAVLRMGANLSGFTPSHKLLNRPPQPFPVLPLF